MKKLIYLLIAIAVLGLIVTGCENPVIPPAEQGEPTILTRSVSRYVATTGSDTSGDGSDGNPWETIQYAINNVKKNTTIIVAAGTYIPSSTIIIDKNNLTLIGPQADIDPRPSVGGRTGNEAVIDGNMSLGMIICIDADNVVINGFEIKSGTSDMVSQGQHGYPADHGGTVVKYNIIHEGDDECVQLKHCSNGVLEYNYVYDVKGDAFNFAYSKNCIIRYNEAHHVDDKLIPWGGAIYTYNSTNIDIIGNIIRDTYSHGIVYGGTVKGGSTWDPWPGNRNFGGKVEGNTVYNVTGDGLWLLSDNTIVKDNEIYGCSRNGIQIIGKNIVVQNNDLHDNDVGISVKDKDPIYSTNISVHVNNLAGNNWGIHSEVAATTVNARANWWGDASGPTHEDNPNGTGVEVSDYVLYKPWLKKVLPKW